MARPSTGANLNIAQLEQILNNRRTEVGRLSKQRKDLQRKLDALDREIERVGGNGSVSGGKRGTRARNDQSLAETIEQVMRGVGKPMGVGDITAAVEATGYRSNSASFRAIINQTLIKERKRFAKAGERGVYQLKK
jgi:septal ring factor EnvC (AmiA/AmiB activator)